MKRKKMLNRKIKINFFSGIPNERAQKKME
jgi:hypothetical protein